MSGAEELARDLIRVIINPLLLFVSALGVLVFVFGMVEFLYGLNTESDARERGKKHMIWGLVGVFIIVVAYGIVRTIVVFVGADVPALYR